MKDIEEFKRPREKYIQNGPQALEDFELLAILLGTGYKNKNAIELAKSVLKSKSVGYLFKSSYKDLSKVKGIGKNKAVTILACTELARRMYSEPLFVIQTPEDVLPLLLEIKNKHREHFIGLYLNARRELLSSKVISIGTVDASIAHPRNVFLPAIKLNASSILIAHNHPSGDPEPSDADIALTRRMSESGSILGIELVDHIIIAKKGYTSMRERSII